jgi:hypothetical protein
MSATLARLITIGEIARRTGKDIHKIEYIIKTRGIRPLGLAGAARVYDEAAVEQVADELRRIGARRARPAGVEVGA